MRVTDEMVDAAIAADSHASWWAGNNREGSEKRMRAALEAALAVEGTEAEPVAWRTNIFESVSVGKLSRLILDADEVEDPDKDWQPLYTIPPAGIREALEAMLTLHEAHHNEPIHAQARAALRGQS